MKQFWQLQFCVWKEVTGNIFKSGILLWGMAVLEAREGRIQTPPWGWQRGWSSRKLPGGELTLPGRQNGRHGPKGTSAASGRSGLTGCIVKHSAGPRSQQSGQGGGLSRGNAGPALPLFCCGYLTLDKSLHLFDPQFLYLSNGKGNTCLTRYLQTHKTPGRFAVKGRYDRPLTIIITEGKE